MPTAPPSLPPPLNASRSFLKALHTLSPQSLLRVREKHAQSRPPPAANSAHGVDSAKLPMPVRVADMLLQLIDFLERHHKREEGLYRRELPAGARETLTILRALRDPGDGPLPHLAAFSPHSIAAAIKEVLGEDFEPLIPYAMSQMLLESSAVTDENAALNNIITTIKRLAPTRRELLKALLIHLHHISTSIPSRMDAKSLAKHIGVLVIRPTDEIKGLFTKNAVKHRRRIARLMIENATALPNDEESRKNESKTMEPEATSDAMDSVDNTSVKEAINESAAQVHYVQVLWDPKANDHTQDSVKELLSHFGQVATLAISESGNRAIAAFEASDSAQAAAEAELPGVRIRRRKQRRQESTHVTSTPNPTREAESPSAQISVDKQSTELKGGRTVESMTSEGEQTDRVAMLNDSAPMGIVASIDNTPVESPTFLYKHERPPSLYLVQKVMETMQSGECMMLEDFGSPRTSDRGATNHDDQKTWVRKSLSKTHEVADDELTSVEDSAGKMATSRLPEKQAEPETLKHRLFVDTAVGNIADSSAKRDEADQEKRDQRKRRFSPQIRTRIGLISDLKSMIPRKRTSRSGVASRAAHIVDPIVVTAEASLKQSAETGMRSPQMKTRSVETQTNRTIRSVQDQSTNTDDAQTVEKGDPSDVHATTSDPSADIHSEVEGLSICLSEVKNELINLASALSATRQSDVDKAVLHAHERVIGRITLALDPEPTECTNGGTRDLGHASTQGGSATTEFVCFLEMRSSTQVKILEAEVRAGQELLRLHRSQHQKEVAELEAEVTSFRVVQKETEKMCADLRSELRKCRSELTCQVATAASMQRERRDADEKLIIYENRLREKEQELLQLQTAHDEMRDVAGSAQRRLEEHRGLKIQPQDAMASTLLPRTDFQLPQTAAFLKLGPHQEAPPAKTHTMISTVLRPGHYANTDALSTMKKKLEERIHQQTEATKKSLRELQAFGTQSASLEDDDLDREQLEQQLASARADMLSTINESRRKLEYLLNPTARIMDGTAIDQGDIATTTFDATGLVESLLANALLAETSGDDLSSGGDGVSSFEPVELLTPSWQNPLNDAQSEMYRRWIHTRAQQVGKKAPSRTLPVATRTPTRSHPAPSKPTPRTKDNSLQQAHESMVRFQQALASMKKPSH